MMDDEKTIGQATAGKAMSGIAARNKALKEMAEPPAPPKKVPEMPVPKPKVVESKGPGQQSNPKVTETKTGTLTKLKKFGSGVWDIAKSAAKGE
jgi:hypothetical protein